MHVVMFSWNTMHIPLLIHRSINVPLQMFDVRYIRTSTLQTLPECMSEAGHTYVLFLNALCSVNSHAFWDLCLV